MTTDANVRETPMRVDALEGGAVWRVLLSTPKANLLDRRMSEALTAMFEEARRDTKVKAIVIEGDGPNFSFGASVKEHMPDQCAVMLLTFHGLFRTMLDAAIPTIAAVRGQCLGGGLELAAFCHRVFASPDARLGQPEIVLGVFAPVASIVLADRMGRGGAEDLLLSGHSIDAAEALRLGLVDEVTDDPSAAAIEYARTHLLPRSASSLRFAVRAARTIFSRRFLAALPELESLYLHDLMHTHDAGEGLAAFLEKRPPRWSDA